MSALLLDVPPQSSGSKPRGFLFLALGQKKIPGLLEGRGLRWIPEALEVSGLTRQQSTRFQRRSQVTARLVRSGGSGRLGDPADCTCRPARMNFSRRSTRSAAGSIQEVCRAQRDATAWRHVGLELRNVDANYPFERTHRFAGIQPNSGHGDHSRLSCSAGIRWTFRAKRACVVITDAEPDRRRRC